MTTTIAPGVGRVLLAPGLFLRLDLLLARGGDFSDGPPEYGGDSVRTSAVSDDATHSVVALSAGERLREQLKADTCNKASCDFCRRPRILGLG